jgi:uncharacterized protein YuzE
MTKTVSYDKENDILFIHRGFSPDEKFKGNIDADVLILDVSTKGRIRGIEIINASKFFKEFDIDKDILENLVDAKFNAVIKPNAIIVSIIFTAKDIERELSAKIAVPLAAPVAV